MPVAGEYDPPAIINEGGIQIIELVIGEPLLPVADHMVQVKVRAPIPNAAEDHGTPIRSIVHAHDLFQHEYRPGGGLLIIQGVGA